jgi:dTDP-4-amino-4,6-dideoxygalactose transaminase
LTITARGVLDALTPATRAVLPVLYGGRAVDLTDVQDQLDRHAVTVIEDAAHAFGSRHGDVPVGARPGVATCFSFGPIKNLTCMEGGMLVPRGSAANARRLRLLGITQSQAQRATATSYAVDGYGLRGTLSNVHAAVGLVQLDHFPEITDIRKTLWTAYAGALRTIGVTVIDLDIERTVPFHCVVRVERRNQVHRLLQDRSIGVGVHYPPNHQQPAFARWHRPLPATEQTAEEILSLPFHPAMSISDVGYVVDALAQALTDTASTTEAIR